MKATGLILVFEKASMQMECSQPAVVEEKLWKKAKALLHQSPKKSHYLKKSLLHQYPKKSHYLKKSDDRNETQRKEGRRRKLLVPARHMLAATASTTTTCYCSWFAQMRSSFFQDFPTCPHFCFTVLRQVLLGRPTHRLFGRVPLHGVASNGVVTSP